MKKYFEKIKFYIDIAVEYWKKIVIWRKKRMVRFKGLPWYRKALNLFLTFIWVFILYLFLVDINFLWLFGKSPSLRSISNPNQAVASEIITSDGKILGKYYHENRTPVTFGEISPKLINTLICTEDERFYKHFGIDIQGVFAAIKDMPNYDLTIYDRNGIELYKGTDGWDGKRNGKAVGCDTYFYLIKYQDARKKTRTLKGSVTIIK